MPKPTTLFWWDVCMENWTTGVRLAETMAAVPAVVGARMPMIRTAIADPIAGDYVELYKMVAEKAEAFTLAGLSLARDMQAIQTEMLKPTRSTKAAAASSARIGQRVAGAAGRALSPVHAAATGNAKRLARKKKR